MRRCAVILSCLVLGTPAWSDDVSFPYTAEVSVDEVEVRCGPDWQYYSTGRLKRGEKVDVYRHEPGGWLAIRPPQGSFSWIPARQVQRGENARVGKVLIDGAVAWVGSSVTSVQQHKWQVRLDRDELVEILGERSMSVGPGFATETYYQIAPPAGEFRWIHAEYPLAPEAMGNRSSGRTVQQADHTAGSSGMENNAGGTSSAQGSTPTSLAREGKDLDALKRQVDQLKLDLSLLVSQQIAQWNLQSLQQRAAALADSTKGTALARQVRLLVYRIEEFEALQQRHRRMAENPAASDEDPRIQRHGVSPAPQIEQDDVKRTSWQEGIADALETNQVVGTGIDRLAAEMEQEKEPTFDAEGWLMPVHSTRRVAPPFALLDDDGRVICYVQPSPGLNLRRFTKKYVGLFGEKRRMTDLRASLLTATRVVRRSH